MFSILQRLLLQRKANAFKSIAQQKKAKTHQMVSLESLKKQPSEPKLKTEVKDARRNSKPTQSFIVHKSKSPKINVHIQRTPNTTKHNNS